MSMGTKVNDKNDKVNFLQEHEIWVCHMPASGVRQVQVCDCFFFFLQALVFEVMDQK